MVMPWVHLLGASYLMDAAPASNSFQGCQIIVLYQLLLECCCVASFVFALHA